MNRYTLHKAIKIRYGLLWPVGARVRMTDSWFDTQEGYTYCNHGVGTVVKHVQGSTHQVKWDSDGVIHNIGAEDLHE